MDKTEEGIVTDLSGTYYSKRRGYRITVEREGTKYRVSGPFVTFYPSPEELEVVLSYAKFVRDE